MAINEERSYTEYNVEVPTTDFPIGFDTLDDGLDVVAVTLNDVDPTTLGYTVSQVNSTTYRFAPTVPSGVVRLTRITDIDQMAHVFTEGAIFISENMDGNFKQIRHAQQEVRDEFSQLRTDIGFTNLEQTVTQVQAAYQDTLEAKNAAEHSATTSMATLAAVEVQANLTQDYANAANAAKDIAQQSATDATTQVDTLKNYVDAAVGAISTDASKQYATLALANADISSISLNQNVFISEAVNGGYWYKSTAEATSLTKSDYDPLAQANVYTNTAIKSKPLGVLDLNTIFTEGVYSQQTAANATALRNYPDHAQNTNSSMRVVAMTANTIMQIVEAVGKISTRMIFGASTAPTFQAWNTSLNKADKTLIDSSIETVNVARKEFAIWSVSGSNGKVSYDKATKTLTWNNALVAAFANVSKRIQIAAGSIAFTNAYDTLFLDLNNVPLNGTVTTGDFAACLKVAKYSDSIATAFIQKNNQLALAQLNSQGELIAAVGFPSLATAPKDTFAYTKALDRITFYQPATNGNLIKYLLRHDVYPFDGTSSRSQTDIWRLERAIEVNAALAELQEIVTYGEWEFAMREAAYPADHVGGVHGDEVLTSALFIVDGVYKDPLTWTGTGEAKEIRLQMQSVIYRLNTQTAIADHYKELVITKNGITANQWVENRLLLNPDRFWLAMLPVNRMAANSVQVSTKDIRNGVVRDVSNAGFAQVYTPLESGSYVNVSGEKYSTSVEISNLQGSLETADIYVANDAAYNKIYASAIGGASSGVVLPTGVKISWTAKYKVDVI